MKRSLPFTFLLASLLLVCGSYRGFAAPTEIPVTEENCKKISGISRGLKEGISKDLSIPMSSIEFVGAYYAKVCTVKIDTLKGILRCDVTPIYTDGNVVWAGGHPFLCN